MMQFKRLLLLWLMLGTTYTTIEVLWRGYTHPVMFVVGGLCGLLVGTINQVPRFYNLKVIFQAAIGAFIVLAVEFVSGLVLNVWMGLDIWDYSGLPGNVMGQICLLYGLLWLFLMPFAIWLEDTLRWCIYYYHRDTCGKHTDKPPDIEPYTLQGVYGDFIKLK